MSQPKPLYHCTSQIKSALANLSEPQSEAPAAFSFGIARAKSRALNAVARELPFLGIPGAMKTRLRRFISNGLDRHGATLRAPRLRLAMSAAHVRMLSLVANVRPSPNIHRSAVGGESGGVNALALGPPLVSEPAVGASANPPRAEIADKIKAGEKSVRAASPFMGEG